MNVSRPQFRIYPVEKWGKPAANETIGSEIPTVGGNNADLTTAPCWTDARARALMKLEPFWMNFDIWNL